MYTPYVQHIVFFSASYDDVPFPTPVDACSVFLAYFTVRTLQCTPTLTFHIASVQTCGTHKFSQRLYVCRPTSI